MEALKKRTERIRRGISVATCLMLVVLMHLSSVGSVCSQADVAAAIQSSNAASVSAGSAAGSGREVEKLLGKYFRRIDSYLKQNKYRLARNELKKVYLIDPSNAKAKNYENLISRSRQDELKKEETVHDQKEALLDAETKIRKERVVSNAYERLKDKRVENAWSENDEYMHSGQVDMDEFERLQTLGVDKYKAELVSEAQAYIEQENYDRAISRYEDALAVDPGDLIVKELLNDVRHIREKRVDDIIRQQENIEDREFMQEVSKTAMGIDDFRKSMKGEGYARPHVGPKKASLPVIHDKMQIPITADFRDVDLVSVLNFLSDYTGINIIASQLVTSETRPITVRFKELPLERALKYLIKGQGLSYRIDNDLIWVATVEEIENEELETKIFYLEKGSGVFSTFASSNMGSLGTTGGSASVSGTKSIKELIEEAVPFPPGAKVVFDDRTGALIVTNTPANLEKIEQILFVVDEPPQQVLIESRFIEINMDEWETFGMNANLDSRLFVDTEKNIGANISNVFTGVSQAANSETGGFVFDFTGLLTDPQFSIVLNALKRMTKTKTLSAPKITTINNQTATIKVVTEEVYPTEFEVSLIQQDLNGDGDLDDAGETEFANVPQNFVTRDIGIILQVTPSVGIDKKTITLSVVPEVSTVAQEPAKFAITSYDSSGNEVQQGSGTPNLPRFSTSTLSTTVVLETGQTAVLGGLIKETIGQTKEKTPFLGDLPWIGRLWRSSQDEVTRTNLVIFITAKVVSA